MTPSKRRDTIKGLSFSFSAAVAATMVYIASKGAMLNISSSTFCVFWFGTGSIYFLLYHLLITRFKNIKISARDIPILLIFGTVETLSAFTFFEGIRLGNPGTLAFIANSSGILFLLFLGILLLRERFNIIETAGLAITLAGIYTMMFKDREIEISAVLIILGTLSFSIGTVIVRSFRDRIDGMTFSSVRPLIILFFSLIYAAVAGDLNFPPRRAAYIMLGGALFGPFASMIFHYQSLKYIEASKTVIIRTIQPVMVLIVSYIVFRYAVTPREFAGAGIITFGVAIVIWGKIRSGGRALYSS